MATRGVSAWPLGVAPRCWLYSAIVLRQFEGCRLRRLHSRDRGHGFSRVLRPNTIRVSAECHPKKKLAEVGWQPLSVTLPGAQYA